MKTFGQYIRERRESLGLNQDALEGFGQSYIAEIETGRKLPAKWKTIEKLVKVLKWNPTKENITRLWIYSLLDQDPYEYFGHIDGAKQAASIAEAPSSYQTHQSHEIHIPTGASPEEVKAQLGKPDKVLRLGSKSKWSYYKEEVHVIFENDQATDIIFK